MAEETREFETDSFVCDYHVCWMPVIGEQLVSEREEGNPRDRYTVAIKSGNIVGHMPRNISQCLRSGTMLCVVSGRHRYSRKFFNDKHLRLAKIRKHCKSFSPRMI